MAVENMSVLIMAAGTGGHIFPALAVADSLLQDGAQVFWLGSKGGMEADILHKTDIPLYTISVKGLRGKGVRRLLLAPIMIVIASLQAIKIMRQLKPDCVLGFGGFVCGPGGLAARLTGRPLLIHDQNAVAGTTNKILAGLASKVMEAFPGTFKPSAKVIHTGNPVRPEIFAMGKKSPELAQASRALRILVLGGSQGSVALNEIIPPLLAQWSDGERAEIFHQAGKRNLPQLRQLYQDHGLALDEKCRVEPFIDDMVAAYHWADLVICRSGASTVTELATIGMPSILVPYPHHADNQQTLNAQWLADVGAAILLPQAQLSVAELARLIAGLNSDRKRLLAMSAATNALKTGQAIELIKAQCREAIQ